MILSVVLDLRVCVQTSDGGAECFTDLRVGVYKEIVPMGVDPALLSHRLAGASLFFLSVVSDPDAFCAVIWCHFLQVYCQDSCVVVPSVLIITAIDFSFIYLFFF